VVGDAAGAALNWAAMMTESVQTQIPDRLRLRLAFDPGRLAEDLARLRSVEWTEHFVKQNYDGDWSAIPLRASAGATHPIMQIYSDPTAKAFEDTPLLARTPYFREVLAAFLCPLRAVRLMRLAPGSIIKEHDDLDLAFESGMVRLHVPITTNPQVEFRLNGSCVVMAPGSVWYLRLSDPHSVSNKGTTDRVHLVIDALANDWLAVALKDAARS
jgi:hypothetical protein